MNKQSDEVYHAISCQFGLTQIDMNNLIQLAENNQRKRARFCCHLSPDKPVHQMFIVHERGEYIRPHKHLKKSESMLVLEGEVDYVTFTENGEVEKVLALGNYQSGKTFYHTIGPDQYHALVIRSQWLVFLEVTTGPFTRKDNISADWSPIDKEATEGSSFLESLLLKWREELV